jgi:uncharacterized protein YggT (Ycf19 family)
MAEEQSYMGIVRVIKIFNALIIILGILTLARIVLEFFGQLKTVPGYQFVMNITGIFMPPFKSLGSVNTPYNGIFDIGATALLLVVLLIEFGLTSLTNSLVRRSRLAAANKATVEVRVSGLNSPTTSSETKQENQTADKSQTK